MYVGKYIYKTNWIFNTLSFFQGSLKKKKVFSGNICGGKKFRDVQII